MSSQIYLWEVFYFRETRMGMQANHSQLRGMRGCKTYQPKSVITKVLLGGYNMPIILRRNYNNGAQSVKTTGVMISYKSGCSSEKQDIFVQVIDQFKKLFGDKWSYLPEGWDYSFQTSLVICWKMQPWYSYCQSRVIDDQRLPLNNTYIKDDE